MLDKRASGILLHITSLPSPYGIGDLGPWAYKFADFLAESRQKFWQVLPLHLTDLNSGNSPYNSISAFAGNTLLISPEIMIQNGFLFQSDIEPVPSFSAGNVDYSSVISYKDKIFSAAYERFKSSNIINKIEYLKFCEDNSSWLEDLALFIVLKQYFKGRIWSEWPREIKNRESLILQIFKNQFYDKIEMQKFLQYMFCCQWKSFKRYCNDKGIYIIGDIPIYVDYNSADVWKNSEIFKLDERKYPSFVAGVPPDYYSKTGQLWGNPVYNWDKLKETGYDWWLKRIKHSFSICDIIRVDHFRGFISYWEIPAAEKTAVNGKWEKAPAYDFFNTLLARFPGLPMIAEDLGYITADVKEVINHFKFPGMKIFLFAFGEDYVTNPYAPHNHIKDCVLYTGTHDNNTIRGWFEEDITEEDKKRLFACIGKEVSKETVSWELIKVAMNSIANTVILPMQDILGLGEEARMNIPATTSGNWKWRLLPEQLNPSLTQSLLDITKTYNRA